MKAQVLDQGKFAGRAENWVETEGDSFQLYVDGHYVASITALHENSTLIVVSTLHKVELKGDA